MPWVEQGKQEEYKLFDFELVTLLGEGAFGKVHKAKDKKTGGNIRLKKK